MTNLTALSLTATLLVLAACSDAEATDDKAPDSPDAVEQPGATGTDAPCPSAAQNSETKTEPSGPKKALSPVEVCDGAYHCRQQSSTGAGSDTKWLTFDGTSCRLADSLVLTADGRTHVAGLDETWGHWTGDYATFSMTRVNDPQHTVERCTRIPTP